MRDFEYEVPTSLANAVELLRSGNGTAKALAGGTDLIDQIRTGRLTPDLLIDVKRLPELNILRHDADGLRLGSAVPCYQILANDGIGTEFSALADAAGVIGGVQIQSRASVGGNLCNSGPAGDSIPALIALGAICVITGPDGTREVPAEDFCVGPNQNVLGRGELLVELKFPARQPHAGSHYRRFTPRNEMDIAVVGVGASVVLDERGENIVSARIGLGAVSATPLLAREAGDLLSGQPVGKEMLERAGEAARAVAKPISDMRGTAEFRLHLIGVLTERVLTRAIERARAAG